LYCTFVGLFFVHTKKKWISYSYRSHLFDLYIFKIYSKSKCGSEEM
jgi:hypothetical protein